MVTIATAFSVLSREVEAHSTGVDALRSLQGSEANVWLSSSIALLLMFLKQALSLNEELTHLARQAGQRAPGSPLSLPPHHSDR